MNEHNVGLLHYLLVNSPLKLMLNYYLSSNLSDCLPMCFNFFH